MRLLTLTLVVCAFVVSPVAADEKKKEEEPTADEKAVLEQVNKERAKESLPPLKINPLLLKAARAHSANMAKQNKLNHTLDGKGPRQRVVDLGYKCGQCGENIAAGGRLSPEAAMKMWMASPPHHANIMHKKYTEIGIGRAVSASGQVYYTQVFGEPR